MRKNLFLGLGAILFGLIGLIAGSFLVLRPVVYQGRAGSSALPKEVKLTNLSPNSASVSWVTASPAMASVVYGVAENALSSIAPDDRGAAAVSLLHHVTLKNLHPATTYYFRLVSGGWVFDNQNQPYVLATPQHSAITPAPPFIIKGKTNSEAIVYFSFNDSTPLSVLSDEKGNFLLTLSNVLQKNSQEPYLVQKGELGYLLFQNGQSINTKEVVVNEEMFVSTLETGSEAAAGQEPKSLTSKLPSPSSARPLVSWFWQTIQFFKRLLGAKE